MPELDFGHNSELTAQEEEELKMAMEPSIVSDPTAGKDLEAVQMIIDETIMNSDMSCCSPKKM